MAKVFVSVLGDERQWDGSLAALASARGFVRNWLRQHLDLRVTPELDFRPDRSMEHAARIQSLLQARCRTTAAMSASGPLGRCWPPFRRAAADGR